MAHSALAFGLVIASFLSGIRVDLMAYLVGDILAVGKWDLLIIWLGSLFVVSLISYRWSPLILSTLDNDLARASGINPEKERLALVLMLAIVVAVAIKVVGALLIVAMLLIPTAAARVFSNSPEKMSLLAGLIGSISVILGLLASYHLNTPAGPSIVCLAAILFIISTIIGLLQKQKSL
jgi:zinc transport system permease protein